MRLAGGRLRHHPSREGLTTPTAAGPVWNGEVRLNTSVLDQPLRWRRGRRIFVCAHGDLFHRSVPDAWIDRVFSVMARAPQHRFLVLTKRSARMREFALDREDREISRAMDRQLMGPLPAPVLPNVWLGVSVEDQKNADARIPDLLATPAALRWISAEPLLGALDIKGWLPALDWVVVGGESGAGARRCPLYVLRELVEDCWDGHIPVFVKQLGSAARQKHPKGGDPAEWPRDLRFRQYPE